MHAAADRAPEVLRLSMDATATVKVGPFARGGTSRVTTKARDHDFTPEATVPPVGSLLPATDELFVYEVTSKVTRDCLVDCLERWWEAVCARFPHITTLVINLENGPEHHSRRTQVMQRIVDFVRQYRLVEWSAPRLERGRAPVYCQHDRIHPVVELITTVYQTGVSLTKDALDAIEAQIARRAGLDKWFVDITPAALGDV